MILCMKAIMYKDIKLILCIETNANAYVLTEFTYPLFPEYNSIQQNDNYFPF